MLRTILVVALVALLLPGAVLAKEQLVVYTYDSFVSWGPAEAIETGFEALHPGVDVVFVAPGSSGDALARLITEMETGGTDADVFLGISDTQLPERSVSGLFEPYDTNRLTNLKDVPGELRFDETGHVVPVDVGYVTLVYDSAVLDPSGASQSLEELTDPRFRGRVIMINHAPLRSATPF